MMAGYEWFSPTRTTGLLSYAISFGACAWAWFAEGRRGRPSGEFLLLAAVQLGLVVDMAFDIRWKLHEFFMTRAMELHVYGERRDPQLLALILLAGVLLCCAWWILRRFRGRRGLALALTGTMLSIGLWFCEMLSYHFMDHVLYSMLGNLMLVSFLWLGLALATCCGVWLEGVARRSRYLGHGARKR
jgi:hypothetical protein